MFLGSSYLDLDYPGYQGSSNGGSRTGAVGNSVYNIYSGGGYDSYQSSIPNNKYSAAIQASSKYGKWYPLRGYRNDHKMNIYELFHYLMSYLWAAERQFWILGSAGLIWGVLLHRSLESMRGYISMRGNISWRDFWNYWIYYSTNSSPVDIECHKNNNSVRQKKIIPKSASGKTK